MSWPKRKWFHRDPNAEKRTCVRCINFDNCPYNNPYIFPDDLSNNDCDKWEENKNIEWIDISNCD